MCRYTATEQPLSPACRISATSVSVHYSATIGHYRPLPSTAIGHKNQNGPLSERSVRRSLPREQAAARPGLRATHDEKFDLLNRGEGFPGEGGARRQVCSRTTKKRQNESQLPNHKKTTKRITTT
jgi:hypothetical protein